MKRKAFGILLALALAMVPVALFSTSAVAADTGTVRVINGNLGGTSSIDVYLDGVKVLNDLAIATGVDIDVAAGSPLLNACRADSSGVAGDGTCQVGGVNTPAAQIGTKNQALTIDAGSNNTLAIVDAGTPAIAFPANDLSITGLGEFNYTFNYAVPAGFAPPALDVCINGQKVITGATGGTQTVALALTAVQDAPYAIFPSASGCASPQANVSFAPGINFVQTAAGTTNPSCAAGCVQVLSVGEDTVPNNPDTVAFCNTILVGPASLSGFQPAFKALVGDVDPTSTTTIKNTQPSFGDMKNFVETYTAVLQAGDASVPPSVADAWATATAGIRSLLQGFQLVNYDLSKIPPASVQNIVLGANGIDLPGVPPDQAVVDATAAITAFVTGTCLASTPVTPVTPVTPAAPVAAGPRFTG